MPGMKEYKQFNCRDTGMECDFKVQAESENEVISHGLGHVCRSHGQCRVSPLIEEKVRLAIKNVWMGSGRFLEG